VVSDATAISTRPGWYQCNACRKQFSVTVGTLFERSHIPLNKWLMAAFLLCASKKGISTHQMHRMIGISYKSTWFMMHRLREAMRDGNFPGPLGRCGGRRALRCLSQRSAQIDLRPAPKGVRKILQPPK
jgi:hypothetical protein